MTEHTRDESQQIQPPIRRVVVALDASPCSRAVLRSAARIAAGLNIQLEGLFVEDVRLLDLAELPIAAEVRTPGGVRPFNRSLAERELGLVAQTVEKWAGQIARSYKAEWHFQVVRGDVAQSVMEAAGPGALLSLGRFGNPIYTRSRGMGSVARRVLGEHQKPLLLLHREIRPGQPILLITSGAVEELPLVAMAVRLSQVYTSPLIVLTENPAAEAFLAAALADQPQTVSFHRLESGNLAVQIFAHSRGRGGIVLSHRRDAELAESECALLLL
ncbi:MAG: universal stress protein [Caldilineaceae bacterium]|nr:universal stress protein [Caldilineaceae bacterium]HRJ44192.1 universal stress protein [Caldilineaceae bacterium]